MIGRFPFFPFYLLVVYVDDFKMARPSQNQAKAWESVKAAVEIGELEAYGRYFGMHNEVHGLKTVKHVHLLQACMRDWWEHDVEKNGLDTTWWFIPRLVSEL